MNRVETPQPWAENWQARRTFELLAEGPLSTVELQAGTQLVHVARQIWELRHWYGCVIQTRRLPNRVAVYELVGLTRPDRHPIAQVPVPTTGVQMGAGL